MRRDVARAVGTAIASPTAASTQTSRSTIQMTEASGAEGHPQPDLTRPARHGIRHRRVKADASDRQRQDCERAAQPRAKTIS